MSIKVYIIDDDFFVRQATTSLLTKDERTEVIGTASRPAEAIKAFKHSKTLPDIILLDLDFKHAQESGLQAIGPLKEALPNADILIFSMSRDEELILKAMQAGANGYIWKNDAAEGLGSAIERVRDGNFVVTESVARLIFGKVSGLLGDRPAEILPQGKRYVDLTKRVEQVMRLFCIDGMSASEIAEALHISENTVRGHIKTGYEIVGATSRHQAFQKLIARADE
ncbi:MAG: response regulator transcription factor [Anaerolineae bacterium]|nr:response regulator transcription factor [Anaerolineae bacterium]